VTKRHKIQVDDLASLLSYILGRRPDEFGLVPDREGFVPRKRLLQAVREEPGWSHVGEGLLQEVLMSEHRRLFESDERVIRTLERDYCLDLENPARLPQGLLYTPVRNRAHFHALERGLGPRPEGDCHILTEDLDTALRIGRRIDPSPVVLEVRCAAAGPGDAALYAFGDLFLAFTVPREWIMGPPMGKAALKDMEKPDKKSDKRTRTATRPSFEAGTFILEDDRDPDPYRKSKKGRKRRTWKEDARKTRRN